MSTIRTTAGDRWRSDLARWAIPDPILAAAPANPWEIPAELFDPHHQRCSPASHQSAIALLGGGGTVLDVGCGGGASSLSLVPAAERITGVDPRPAMLASFAQNATEVGVAFDAVEGSWPAAASSVEPHDVVVSHNVAYNVPDIEDFLLELTNHATRGVVIEVTLDHPQSALNDLWVHFHDVKRPTSPTWTSLVDVLSDLGIEPHVTLDERGTPESLAPRPVRVGFARQRLCLPPSRDPEVDALLPLDNSGPPRSVATITWVP
jgi:SAM-dependent methyltransferase